MNTESAEQSHRARRGMPRGRATPRGSCVTLSPEMNEMTVGSRTISAAFVVALVLSAGCSQPQGISPEWTDPLNGLQFQMVTAKTVLAPGEAILLTISMRNASSNEIAVLDPSKLPDAEKSVVFYPFLFDKKKQKDYANEFLPALEPSFKVEWYTTLKPGEIISGELLVKHNAPVGECYLELWPGMVKPRENVEGETWKKADFDRIHAIAWTNHAERTKGRRVPTLGPVKMEIR